MKKTTKTFRIRGYKFTVAAFNPKVFELAAKLVLKRYDGNYESGCDALERAVDLLVDRRRNEYGNLIYGGKYGNLFYAMFRPSCQELYIYVNKQTFPLSEFGRAYFWGDRTLKNAKVRSNALLFAAQMLRSMK
jgi:hypothetical protein